MKLPTHRISIPSLLEVGPGTLEVCGDMLKRVGISDIIIIYGGGIKELFGATMLESLKRSRINVLAEIDNDSIDINGVTKIAFNIPSSTQAVIGIGGGKAIDTAKYVGFLNDIQIISIPTAASNDGFCSSTCSLIIDGKRKSVSARMPHGIIVDLGVIKSSPEKFIYSGLGDLVSKITALYDWELEEKNGKTIIDGFSAMIARKSINSFIRLDCKDIRGECFLNELIDSLIMSGMATAIAGNSAPASGSEHLISHALDEILENPQLHGIQVGIATYIMSKVQKNMYETIEKIYNETGFTDYVSRLELKAEDYKKAIDVAPKIKPNRHTSIHVLENRETAKRLIDEDDFLKKILR